MRPSQRKSCSHLLPVDVESRDKDLDKYVTAAKHKYWCSSDVSLTVCVKHEECVCMRSHVSHTWFGERGDSLATTVSSHAALCVLMCVCSFLSNVLTKVERSKII